jgi:hypothetical protein
MDKQLAFKQGLAVSRIYEKSLSVFLILIVLLLTAIYNRVVYNTVIFKNEKLRMEKQNLILSGNEEPPYQYRVLKPAAGFTLQKILSVFISNPVTRHSLSYEILLFFTFLGIFSIFGLYLKSVYSTASAIIGILLLQTVIPLSLTGYWQEGDFFNLLFYVIGINLFHKNKDGYLPLIFFIGAFNREQIIFLNVFYASYLYYRNRIFTKKGLAIILINSAVYAVVYFGLRFYFGFKDTQYTTNLHISTNIASIGIISRVWLETVSIFVIFSILAFKKSNSYLRLSFISLVIYLIAYFCKGFMHELAKFMPAYLIMIPMCLRFLNLKQTSEEPES